MAGTKRKRDPTKEERRSAKSKTTRKSPVDEDSRQATILRLESQILDSRRHFNNIAALIQSAKQEDSEPETATLAAVALCRIFSRLISMGDLVKSKGMSQSDVVIVQWLKERYREYLDMLLLGYYLRSGTAFKQSLALTLLMRLVKEESKTQNDYNWKQGPLSRTVESILLLPENDPTRDEFAEKYFKQFDDVRFYTFQTIKTFLESGLEESTYKFASANALSLLMMLDNVPQSKADLDNFYMGAPTQSTNPMYSLASHKSQAQTAWLAAFQSGHNKEQRKTVLRVFSHQIAPWFRQPELLMDFLADSYDIGGATSLLALSGLYYLISERNLDYPSFYQKLYSLLDDTILHSKHRSRFFRLLDTFMSSTHLPAALVASFIKRLARLALNGPPAGIIVVVPWIYNMFKCHPTCTFMIHREIRDGDIKQELEEEGMDDPFDMSEQDPMLTEAIESSLWEIETLQSHYHPNVATLAKIISEQFTKRSYNLEDFLDHSYNVLLDAELSRELKKEPVVDYKIPKHIFSAEEGNLGPLGELMSQVIQ
ncbi:nucleolar complex protein-like protein [Lindgomyces ingoldianus]|uniref:Nucleolar complex protein-like protein n=1 Tax=Lindgomyces ingoldianus TaxID=673940 RepID=A0ACB6QMP0_9PLEO|nr:nucleolar complex protein-like protein [Lindgomyces ingoldianus]KAF2468137.1 nucleolar complex protein-like protein [Lindgomyces ingoldianus]